MANVNIGTVYDMNKQLYARVPHIPDKTVKKRQHRMVAWIDYTGNKYYMLLCRERHDYTVFARLHDSTGDNRKLIDEVVGLLRDRGTLVDIIYDEKSSAYECWVSIKGADDKEEVFMYYLFPYDWGVIEI